MRAQVQVRLRRWMAAGLGAASIDLVGGPGLVAAGMGGCGAPDRRPARQQTGGGQRRAAKSTHGGRILHCFPRAGNQPPRICSSACAGTWFWFR